MINYSEKRLDFIIKKLDLQNNVLSFDNGFANVYSHLYEILQNLEWNKLSVLSKDELKFLKLHRFKIMDARKQVFRSYMDLVQEEMVRFNK
jgi:hypothetical protein